MEMSDLQRQSSLEEWWAENLAFRLKHVKLHFRSCGPINLLCYEGASLSFPSGILHRFAKLFVISAGDVVECVGRK